MQVSNPDSTSQSPPSHWLDRYGSGLEEPYHRWCRTSHQGRSVIYRKQGIVEGFFDTDGTDFEGRADVNPGLTVELAISDLSILRDRLCLAWAIFRYQHALLSAKSLSSKQLQVEGLKKSSGRFFVVPEFRSTDELVEDAKKHITFTADFYDNIDSQEFYLHLINTSRAIDATKALSRLYVLSPTPLLGGTYKLNIFFVFAHQICDGLTIFRWLSSFIDHLNFTPTQLDSRASQLCSTDLMTRLPPAQEDLYPRVRGTPARQRWAWAISRILRHTRKPPPASFQNPLRRAKPLKTATMFPPVYSRLLSYTPGPPLNTHLIAANLTPFATTRLTSICRTAGISIGAGCFALLAIVMMELHSLYSTGIPLQSRLPFVGSFPVNPRPFLSGPATTGKEDSLMLAFSDGVALPFLPSDLPLEGRLRVLGRLAHRQLRMYQKKKQPGATLELGARELIPRLYIGSVDLLEGKALPHEKTGINPQGAYPASVAGSLATCGVSSVGDRSKLLGRGRYDVSGALGQGREKDAMVVDFLDFHNCVRVREGEFLVGAHGDGRTMRFEASVDGCAMDLRRVAEWKGVLEGILEEREGRWEGRWEGVKL